MLQVLPPERVRVARRPSTRSARGARRPRRRRVERCAGAAAAAGRGQEQDSLRAHPAADSAVGERVERRCAPMNARRGDARVGPSRPPWLRPSVLISWPREPLHVSRRSKMSREAVIIDSVRTGLAKAHRGSFNMTRPDDQLAHCIAQLFARNQSVDRGRSRRRDRGLRHPRGSAGHERRAHLDDRRGAADLGRGHHREPLLLVGLAGDHDGRAPDLQEGVDIAVGGGVETITMLQDGPRTPSAC